MKIKSVINAIGHPIRRDIIKRLRSGPLSAGDLSDVYEVSKPTMSVHFKTLKTAEFIYSERSGNHIIYHLNTTVAEEALVLMAELLGTKDRGEHDEKNV
jgi:DNA-binding transcriptional ArsR family regulator